MNSRLRQRFRYILLLFVLTAGLPVTANAAFYDLDTLAEAASATGWRTVRAADGSLLLYPGHRNETAGPELAVRQSPINEAPPLDNLQRRLLSAGWRVHKDRDGSLLLYPRTTQSRITGIQSGPPAPDRANPPAVAAGGVKPVQESGQKSGHKPSLAAAQHSAVDPAMSRDSARGDSIITLAHRGGADGLARLAQSLSDRGWRTERAEDGSLLLFTS